MKIVYKIVLAGLISMLSACGTSPKTYFYLLSAGHDDDIIATEKLAIGVWKVDLPDLIDRPEIVTRTGTHTIDLADFHRWAGGLESNVSALIVNELAYNLKTGHIDISPWSSYRNFDYQVKIHIWSFDGERGGQSRLRGAFVILNGKGDKKLSEEVFSFKQKVNSESYNDMAAAMSQLVILLSKQISQAILMQQQK